MISQRMGTIKHENESGGMNHEHLPEMPHQKFQLRKLV